MPALRTSPWPHPPRRVTPRRRRSRCTTRWPDAGRPMCTVARRVDFLSRRRRLPRTVTPPRRAPTSCRRTHARHPDASATPPSQEAAADHPKSCRRAAATPRRPRPQAVGPAAAVASRPAPAWAAAASVVTAMAAAAALAFSATSQAGSVSQRTALAPGTDRHMAVRTCLGTASAKLSCTAARRGTASAAVGQGPLCPRRRRRIPVAARPSAAHGARLLRSLAWIGP
jgi:hypothetical protein